MSLSALRAEYRIMVRPLGNMMAMIIILISYVGSMNLKRLTARDFGHHPMSAVGIGRSPIGQCAGPI